MVVNAKCPNCEGQNTYYEGNNLFYCKDCTKEFFKDATIRMGNNNKNKLKDKANI